MDLQDEKEGGLVVINTRIVEMIVGTLTTCTNCKSVIWRFSLLCHAHLSPVHQPTLRTYLHNIVPAQE